MEEGRTRRSRDKNKHRQRFAEDEDNIYYRDTEDTPTVYNREEKETRDIEGKEGRSLRENECKGSRKERDEKRPSPEGSNYENRSHRRRHKSSEKKYRSISRDRKQSQDRKSVRYKQEENINEEQTNNEGGRSEERRGRSEERRGTRKREERSDMRTEDEEHEEKRRRRREKQRRKLEKEKEVNINKDRREKHINYADHQNEEYIQTEDSLEKTRRERSTDRIKRKKSKDRVRRKEKEEEKNKMSQSEDEITLREERISRHKSRRKYRSKEKRKEIVTDISFGAPSETYEEMKKTSIDWKPSPKENKKKDKHRKDKKKYKIDSCESDVEDQIISRVEKRGDMKVTKHKKTSKKIAETPSQHKTQKSKTNKITDSDEEYTESKSSKSSYGATPNDHVPDHVISESKQNTKRYKSKPHRSTTSEYEEKPVKKQHHEAKIKKEIRKKREPRLYHSDSEVDMKKSNRSKKHVTMATTNDNDNETSSISSNEKPDIESLYDLYRDPDQKEHHKEVTIRSSSRESYDAPKRISINQTNIRGKLIRVLFQRVKELLKETEELRHERKTLNNKIKSLSEEIQRMQKKDGDKYLNDVSLEKRLEMLADEMKITAKGTSFREEIHKILHDIQDKYQIHWREHESKIQQVQNDAEHNIQTLMKSIVGKYVEMTELNNERSGVKNETKSRSNSPYLNKHKNSENSINLVKERANTHHPVQMNNDKNNGDMIRTVKSDSSLAEAQSVYLQRKATQLNREISDNQTDNPNNAWHESMNPGYHPAYERDNRWENSNIKEDIQKLFANEVLRSTTQKTTRLNEPLFIDTGTEKTNALDEYTPHPENIRISANKHKDLLLQIATLPAENTSSNKRTFNDNRQENYIKSPAEEIDKTALRREKTYCNGEPLMSERNNTRQDSFASLSEKKTSYDTDNLNDLRLLQQSTKYFYDEVKSQPQFKINVKEFWRQKLLQPNQTNANNKGRTAENPYDNKTVRNTY